MAHGGHRPAIQSTSLLEKQTPQEQLLHLNAAIADDDRTRRLTDGRVAVDGIKLRIAGLYSGDFCTQPVYEAYDVAEMSFSWYATARAQGLPVVALPIFPLRVAVFGYVLVRHDSPFYEPKDLIGRRIGVTAYRMTVSLWLRGIFQEYYGLAPEQSTWVRCWGTEGAGFTIPSGIKSEVVDDSTPDELLERGEVDAIYVPELPRSTVEGKPNLRRLFRDPRAEMRRYIKRTGILPITHTIVMRQSLSDEQPWIANSLIKAFRAAQQQSDDYWLTNEKRLAFPDGMFFLEEQRAVYGAHTWAHGFNVNRSAIETFLRYANQQGYTSRHLAPEELFPAHTLSA